MAPSGSFLRPTFCIRRFRFLQMEAVSPESDPRPFRSSEHTGNNVPCSSLDDIEIDHTLDSFGFIGRSPPETSRRTSKIKFEACACSTSRTPTPSFCRSHRPTPTLRTATPSRWRGKWTPREIGPSASSPRLISWIQVRANFRVASCVL